MITLAPRSSPPVSTFFDGSQLADPCVVQPPAQPGFRGDCGPFQIIRELGAGGMGVVYLARDARPQAAGAKPGAADRFVALKVLRVELARHPRAIQRFTAEATHLQQFNHPHIVRVLEIVSVSSCPCLVLPYFPNGSLADRLRRVPPLDFAETLKLTRQIALALDHAHTRGIIHRDLNPANVLLSPDGDACLTDFGLARTVFNDSILHVDHEHHEGTLPYMSPAVARGEAEDTRCDIYGLGALLYELLTGHPPYRARTAEALRRKILAGPPPPILGVNPTAPKSLARIAHWAMERQHRHRYASVADLLGDLNLVTQGGEPRGPHHRTPKPRSLPPVMGLRKPPPGRLWVLAGVSIFGLLATGFLVAKSGLQRGTSVASAVRQAASTPQVRATTRTFRFVVDGERLLLAMPDAHDGPAPPDHSPRDATPRTALAATNHPDLGRARVFNLRPLQHMPSLPTPLAPRVQPEALLDLDGDGRRELLVRLLGSPPGSHDRLGCYDEATALLLWAKDIRPSPENKSVPPASPPPSQGTIEASQATPPAATEPARGIPRQPYP